MYNTRARAAVESGTSAGNGTGQVQGFLPRLPPGMENREPQLGYCEALDELIDAGG